MSGIDLSKITSYLRCLQDKITHAFLEEDGGAKLQEDNWKHPEGGGGRTRAISGPVIEKAGVNFSHIYGKSLPPVASLQRKGITDHAFHATGISVIVHPVNPYVPTCHANVRFFIAEKPGEAPIWWFGGGFDLTPYYGFVEDCIHWHQTAKKACDPFGLDVYPKYKKQADEYFFLKHRHEPRGIGGIFFDDLHEWDFISCFNFLKSVGNHFLEAYLPIVQKRKNMPYTEAHRKFQCYRRGRYVEFNLVYDRGTLFGLQSQGRIESILISLPPEVQWLYNWQPMPNTPEEKLYKEFLVPKDWALMTL